MSVITTARVSAFFASFSLVVWLSVALVASVGLNILQYGWRASAAAQAKLDCLQSAVDAKAASDAVQAERQDEIDEQAEPEAEQLDGRLAAIIASQDATINKLRSLYAQQSARPAGQCVTTVGRLHLVNAQLSSPRPD